MVQTLSSFTSGYLGAGPFPPPERSEVRAYPASQGNIIAHAELAEGRRCLSGNQKLSSFQERNKKGQVAKR